MEDLRAKINELDDRLVALFIERMSVCDAIGAYKRERGAPIYDRQREREVLSRLTDGADSELQGFIKTLYNTIFEIGRAYQSRLGVPSSAISETINTALGNTPAAFPAKASVACQGVEGAYAQLACDRLFSLPNILYCASFEAAFQAVSGGLCRYGVLPLENSTAGSVNEVYSLMNRYNCYISRSVRLLIRHALLAAPGTVLGDIKEIFSHEQALGQCSDFLKTLKGVKITPSANTAVAAKMAAEAGRGAAAISSADCAELYGLQIISGDIQNSDNNYTRFICISKELEIYPGADRTSVILSVPNKPGALYSVLSKVNALGLNLIKLESRPVPGSGFEFRFYFDIDAPAAGDGLKTLLSDLEREPEFHYLGTYQEIY